MKTLTAILQAALGFFMGLTGAVSCGEPDDWLEPRWEFIAEFPEEYATNVQGITVADGALYFTVSSTPNAILKYESARFTEDYVGPEQLWISDVKFSEDKGFACGRLRGNPFLASYDGERWEEEKVLGAGVTTLLKVLTVAGDKCWLLCDLKKEGGRLCFWDGSALTVFGPSGPAAYASRAPDTGYLYSWGKGDKIRLSADGGNTWVAEELLIKQNGLELVSPYSGAAIGEELFIISQLSFNGFLHWGVVRRAGAPGKGECEVAFLSNHGPYFHNLFDIDFRDVTDGLAVGWHTTLHYTAGEWLLETTRELTFVSVVADPVAGYWAVADNHSGSPTGTFLLYQR
jgi:hypothetical protein